jgi:transposase InsO family protein
MSRRGNCYDNAAMESFWSSLKRELVHRYPYCPKTRTKLKMLELRYLIPYRTGRLPTKCSWSGPDERMITP